MVQLSQCYKVQGAVTCCKSCFCASGSNLEFFRMPFCRENLQGSCFCALKVREKSRKSPKVCLVFYKQQKVTLIKTYYQVMP